MVTHAGIRTSDTLLCETVEIRFDLRNQVRGLCHSEKSNRSDVIQFVCFRQPSGLTIIEKTGPQRRAAAHVTPTPRANARLVRLDIIGKYDLSPAHTPLMNIHATIVLEFRFTEIQNGSD